MSTPLDKVLYTAKTHAVGGREGTGRSDDGRVEVKLSSPGGPGQGTNPEQLFGIGYSACFLGAMKAVAPKVGVTVPADTSVDAEVDLGFVRPGLAVVPRAAGGLRPEEFSRRTEAHGLALRSNHTAACPQHARDGATGGRRNSQSFRERRSARRG